MFDADARVFYVPSHWRWNPPENDNVIKGNLKDLNEVPPCGLVDAFARNIETLPETYQATFVERITQRLRKRPPTQYQNPSSVTNQEAGTRATRATTDASRRDPPSEKRNTETENGSDEKLLGVARQVLKFPVGEVESIRPMAGPFENRGW